MFLGPAASVLGETSAPFLWSIVAAPDGSLWAGSGNEGKVLKVAKDGKVTTFFDAAELEVHAIAPAPQGGLYVATSPDGKIYSVAADGSSKTLFDPEDKYIWALASDSSGTLYAATGDKGVIYKITADGKGSPLLQDERHERRLARCHQVRRADRRNRISRPRVPNRCDRKGVRAARFPLSRDPRAPDRCRRHHLCGRRQRDAASGGSDRPTGALANRRGPFGRPVGLDRDHGDDGGRREASPPLPRRPPAGRPAGRPVARSTGSRATGFGTRFGKPARTRRTTS